MLYMVALNNLYLLLWGKDQGTTILMSKKSSTCQLLVQGEQGHSDLNSVPVFYSESKNPGMYLVVDQY